MVIYILTIPFRIIATILVVIFLPLIIILDQGCRYVNDIVLDLFRNIWEVE